MPRTQGIHHITAIASDPAENHFFHAQFLGLRLVKKTVNFDDPTTYHLYYGDAGGRPGTIMTYFPWPGAPRVRPGVGQATVVSYAIPRGSLEFWNARAEEFGYYTDEFIPRFDEVGLALRDPDGIRIELVEGGSSGPDETSIQGFHAATLQLKDPLVSIPVLTEHLGFTVVGTEGARTRLKAAGDRANWVDLIADPDGAHGEMGAGAVHHVAFRAASDEEQAHWQTSLQEAGFHVTEVRDRNYFKSIYFREPGGVLFEIATDAPGFAVDEPVDHLGESLMLPAWLEKDRGRLTAVLPSLTDEE